MFLDPGIGENIKLDGKTYQFTQAVNAPGIIYAEIGRKAKVYRVLSGGKPFALKAFKPKYRTRETVGNTERIAKFQDVPGLTVASRTIISPQKYPDLIKQNEAFAYAILMPWVEGQSWFNYVTGKVSISRQQSLRLARSLVDTVSELEERKLAHCDLSSSNFIFSSDLTGVELIDIEDMFGNGLLPPKEKPKGTGGYAPAWIQTDGVWEASADRFSTGILISEILGWQFEDVREASSGDAYFGEGEFGNKSKRFRLLSDRLEQLHPELANLFKTVWYSESLEECPRVQDWKAILDSIKEPELNVSPTFLKFGLLDISKEPFTEPQTVLKIKNNGGGLLKGKVVSNVPWLSVSPENFSCEEGKVSKHEITLLASAPASRSQLDYTFDDGITIKSKYGSQNISGNYSVELPKINLLPWVFVGGAIILFLIIGLAINSSGNRTMSQSFTPVSSTLISGQQNLQTSMIAPAFIPSDTPMVALTLTPILTPTLSCSVQNGQWSGNVAQFTVDSCNISQMKFVIVGNHIIETITASPSFPIVSNEVQYTFTTQNTGLAASQTTYTFSGTFISPTEFNGKLQVPEGPVTIKATLQK